MGAMIGTIVFLAGGFIFLYFHSKSRWPEDTNRVEVAHESLQRAKPMKKRKV